MRWRCPAESAASPIGYRSRRQAEDHVMRAGGAAGRQHRIGIGREAHARDVFRNGAVEEFDVLGDIADVAAERVLVPLLERGAVEPDLAARGSPDPGQRAHQRRLAGGARSDDGERLARGQTEMHVGHDRGVAAGRGHGHCSTSKRRRPGQVGAGCRAGNCRSVLDRRRSD